MLKRIPYHSKIKDQFFDFIQAKTKDSHLFHRVSDLEELVRQDEDICGWCDPTGQLTNVAVYISLSETLSEIWLLPFDSDALWLPDALVWIKEKNPAPTVRIEIPLPAERNSLRDYLEKNGWEYFYTIQSMELKNSLVLHDLPSTSTHRWQSYEEKYFPSYYQTLVSAFGSAPGISILPYERQFERCRHFGKKLQLLIDQDEVVGFVRVELHSDQTGEIVSLARNPSVQGRGFGRAIVSRGIEVLQGLKANKIVLEVRLNNSQALKLYQEVGFVPVLAMDTLKLVR